MDDLNAGPAASAAAAEVVGLLGQAGVQIALAELGAGGRIADLLRRAPGGADVVTSSRRLPDPRSLTDELGVSEAKMAAFGWLSQMVAAEVAAALIDTYEGGWGLAVLGNPAPGQDVLVQDACVALGTPSTTVVTVCGVSEVTTVAFDLLRRAARERLAARTAAE